MSPVWGHINRSSVAVWHFTIVPGRRRAVLSPMLVSDDYVPQRAEIASWRGHTAPSAIQSFAAAGPRLWNSLITSERGGLIVQ